jgi:hypothetical protein
MKEKQHKIPMPPTPNDPDEASRWDETRLRRRMLDGAWQDDLRTHAKSHLGTTRTAAMGPLDYSANPFRIICRELAALYYEPPMIRHNDGDFDELIGQMGAIANSGIWSSMSRFQAWVIGCREYFLHVSCTEDGDLQYRPVPPDLVIAKATADKPDTPVMIMELRLRMYRDEYVWMWDVFDIFDEANPIYRIVRHTDHGPAEDLTEYFLGGDRSGKNYPYVDSAGKPFLPYVLYHAEHLGDRVFDAYEGMEMVEGSLNLAVAWSFWFHVLRDASWPQRYVVNAAVAGMEIENANTSTVHASAVMDPAALAVLVPLEEGNQTQIGQWSAGGDPEALERAIQSYATKIAQDAGLPASDVQRMSGSARSGYAISLSNDGKRSAQRKFAPQFGEADRELVALSAKIHNIVIGTSFPESGYTVIYQQIPLSPQELDSRREHVLALLEAGLMSKVQAYMQLNPGLTKEQAEQDLSEMSSKPDTEQIDTSTIDAPDVASTAEDLPVDNVAATALNGAQVSSLLEVISSVANKLLPRDSAVIIIQRAFSVDQATAESMLGDVGRTFYAPEQAQGGNTNDGNM